MFVVPTHAVPEAIHIAVVELGLFVIPIYRGDYQLYAHTLSYFLGQIDIIAYNVVVRIPESHGWEGIIQPQNQLTFILDFLQRIVPCIFRLGITFRYVCGSIAHFGTTLLVFLILRTADKRYSRQRQSQQHGKNLFHVL